MNKTCFDISEQFAEVIIWMRENPRFLTDLKEETINRLNEFGEPEFADVDVMIWAFSNTNSAVNAMWEKETKASTGLG